MSLQIISGPSAEPVTLAEVKARLRLTDTADDATITQQITAAREFAEKVTRQSLASKTYKLFMERFPWPNEPIRIPVPPLTGVSAVKYLDSTLAQQTWSAAEYGVYNIGVVPAAGLIKPLPTFTYPAAAVGVPQAVEVDFTAGYGAGGLTIPAHIAEGIRQLAVHIYDHPEAISSEGLKEAPLALMSFFNANKVWVF